MPIRGDGDLPGPFHLPQTGLEGIRVPCIYVLVLLIVDDAAGSLGILIFRA